MTTKYTKEELQEFQAKTISRILEKRRKNEINQLQMKEEEKKETNAFRAKWKEFLKAQREKSVVEEVDNILVKEVLPKGSKSKFIQLRKDNEQQLNSLLSDIDNTMVDIQDLDHKRDSGVYHLDFKEGETPTLSKKASIEFTSDNKSTAASKFLHRITSYGLSINNLLQEELQNELKFYSAQNTTNNLIRKYSNYKLSEFSNNQTQIADMLDDILYYNKLVKDGDPQISRFPCGFMKSLLDLVEHDNNVNFRQAHRHFSFSADYQYFSDSYHDEPNGNIKSPRITPSLPKKASMRDLNPMLGGFIDGCFLVGPGVSTLNAYFAAKDEIDPKFSIESLERSSNLVPTTVLYRSTSNYPPEMITLLPSYCFPNDCELVIEDTTRSSVNRKNQINRMNDPNYPPKPQKRKVFFPSDFSIKDHDALHPDNIVDYTPLSARGPDPNTSNNTRQPFVLVLGDHTYQQFCLSIMFPVTFFDSQSNIKVHTQYCLCLLSSFPFFNYLYNTILRLDEELKLLNFLEPLPSIEDNTPMHPSLFPLNQCIQKLQKISIPIFPYLVKDSKSSPKAGANLRLSDQKSTEDANYFSILPNISLNESIKSMKISFSPLKRSFYQAFYSSHSKAMEDSSEDIMAKIHFHDTLKSSFVPDSIHKYEKDLEDNFFLLLWTLPTLLKYLPLDQIILALGCAITEMKIIVKHKDLNVVSCVVLALTQLLRPLKWCSPVIVTLPEALVDLIDSPVPIILGMQKLPSNFVLMERYVVVDPQERIVHLNPNDVVQSQTILLPNASKLVYALKTSMETILKLSRKRKPGRSKSPLPTMRGEGYDFTPPALSPNQRPINSSNNVTPTGPETPRSMLSNAYDTPMNQFSQSMKAPALPLDLDFMNPDCALLMGAIKQFANTVNNHISAVVNTAIEYQRKEKEQERSKRRILKNNQKQHQAPTAILYKPSNHLPPGMLANNNNNNQALKKANLPNTIALIPDIKINSLDETVSEVTFTDGTVNELNSDGKDSNDSVSTTSSSLPSLKTNAPLLAVKDIGQHGMKFVVKLTETQMYSNYCQFQKMNSPAAPSFDGSMYEPRVGPGITPMTLNRGVPSKSQYFSIHDMKEMMHFVKEEVAEEDSIEDLFVILLTGTIGMDPQIIADLNTQYHKLYSPSPSDPSHIKIKSLELKDISSLVPSIPDRLAKYTIKYRRFHRFVDREQQLLIDSNLKKVDFTSPKHSDIASIPQAENISGALKGDTFLFCNSLLCNGFCNTDYCTEICLNLWMWKVKNLRHNQAAFSVISKKFEKSEEKTDPEKGAYAPKVEYLLKNCIRFEAFRHGKETNSQYQLRKKVISSTIEQPCGCPLNPTDSQKVAKAKMKAKAKTDKQKKKKSHEKIVSLSLFSTEDPNGQKSTKIRKRDFVKEGSKYLHALGHYFAKREQRCVKRQLKQFHIKIENFVKRFIYLYRKKKFHHRFVKIQSLFRGYLSRRALPQYIQHQWFLTQRKYMAYLTIRNFFRTFSDVIIDNFNYHKKIARLNRRTSISLPVDNTNPLAGSVSLSLEPRSPTPSNRKFIKEPSLVENKPVQPAPELNTNMNISLTVSSKADSHFPELPKTEAELAFSQGKKRRPSYSSMAMEFMKFGSILSKSSSFSMNKAIFSKRNSTGSMNSDNETVSHETKGMRRFSSLSPTSVFKRAQTVDLDSSINGKNFPLERAKTMPLPNNEEDAFPATMAESSYDTSDDDEESEENRRKTILKKFRLNKVNKLLSDPSLSENIKKKPKTLRINTQISAHSIENDLDPTYFERIETPVHNSKITADLSSGASISDLLAYDRKPSNLSNFPSSPDSIDDYKSTRGSNRGIVVPPLQLSRLSLDSHLTEARLNQNNSSRIDRHSFPLNNVTNNHPFNHTDTNLGLTEDIKSSSIFPSIDDEIPWLPPLDDEAKATGRLSNNSDPKQSTARSNLDFFDNTSFKVKPVVNSALGEEKRSREDILSLTSSARDSVPDLTLNGRQSLESKVSEEKDSGSKKEKKIEEEDEYEYEEDSQIEADNMDMDFDIYPLKTLGRRSLDFLSRQQLCIIKSMWTLLHKGVPVLKHGRSGQPKRKTLFCDASLTKLYWREPGSLPDDSDDEELHKTSSHTISESKSKRSSIGVLEVMKIRHRSSLSKNDSDRLILIKEILSVTDDCSTEVMQRSLAKNYLTSIGTQVISITVPKRTLDVEIDERIWSDIFYALQILIYYYQALKLEGRDSLNLEKNHDNENDRVIHYVLNRPMREEDGVRSRSSTFTGKSPFIKKNSN